MKMDVSYTDHSHIIGKGGNTIRRVMAETNCHIHFPDSNRSNPNEKSNQVSIAGEMSGVERARYPPNENGRVVYHKGGGGLTIII
jgi:protein bicaudal C